MSQTGGGAMAAVVGLSEQIVEETRKRHGATDVVIANHNAPEQFVLSGSRGELARLRPVFEKTEESGASFRSASADPSTRRRWPGPPSASVPYGTRSTWAN